MNTVLSIVAAGREARNGVDMKLRQPLREASVAGLSDGQWASIERLLVHVKEELNVQTVKRSPLLPDFADIESKLNFRSVGPRLGNRTKAAAREFAKLGDQHADFWFQFQNDPEYSVALVVDGHEVTLGQNDVIPRLVPMRGYGVGQDGNVLVGITKDLDDDLILEGLAREIVHAVQNLRKKTGLEISDRIRLWLDGDAKVAKVREAHGAWIEQEVLAVALNESATPDDVTSAEVVLNEVPVSIRLERTIR
jgi:isoleucyl-tRNA synthetase